MPQETWVQSLGWEDSMGWEEGNGNPSACIAGDRRCGFDPWAVKIPWVGKEETATHLPALQETQEMRVRSLGWEDSVGWEEGNGNPLQYTCLENPMDKEPGGLQSIGSQSQKQLKWLNTHTHTLFSSYQVGNRSIKTLYSFLLDSID